MLPGADSTYRATVGRSGSAIGPCHNRSGTGMTRGRGRGRGTEILVCHGPGHQDLFAYHYYADDGTAPLGTHRLGWESAGGPYVR
ncbi:hypothetical protein [Nocardiopsis sp. CNT312]|uniref:hypothetical protein n=1 Tax=Nocardiopsis sp. CNT312 TaxID=1137268 RepID=UPI00049021E4|nr:hypothetical protein [Nocardiopsis sp. CNT312]